MAPLTISIASIIQAAGCDATVCRSHYTFVKNRPYIIPSWNIKQQMLLWAILFLDNWKFVELLTPVKLCVSVYSPVTEALTNVISTVDVPPILGRSTELIVVNILVKIITNAIDFNPRLTFVHYETMVNNCSIL